MDIPYSDCGETMCQVASVAVLGTMLIRLAVSSWLVGRVDELPGDKKNLFRLDGLGNELRMEMLATLVYQSLNLFHLPNFGTYMVEKGFIPKSAAQAGLKPKGRLWWVKIADGQVVSRKIIEDNGAINTSRPYDRNCYTDANGNLASQIIVCGEGIHESMAPDECFKDSAAECEKSLRVVEENKTLKFKAISMSTSPFTKHSGNSTRTAGDSTEEEPKKIKVRKAEGINFDRIFVNRGELGDCKYLSKSHKRLRDYWMKNYSAQVQAAGGSGDPDPEGGNTISPVEENKRDVRLVNQFIQSIGEFITEARDTGYPGVFRTEAWRILIKVYPSITRLRIRDSTGASLGVKFEDLRYAIQIYSTLSEHEAGMHRDHKLIAITSTGAASWLRDQPLPRIRAHDGGDAKHAGYVTAAVDYLGTIVEDLQDGDGCLNPLDRMLAAETVIREFMAEMLGDRTTDVESSYAVYKAYLEARNFMKLVEGRALDGRKLDYRIAISKVDLDVE